MQREDLTQPREATPIARFIGASNAMIVNPITKKSEFFYDFVLRHSLYRPRDLMLIGGKIAQIPASVRTQERLRVAVDQAAGEIVWHYLAEMRGLTEVPDRSLFGLIPSNVLDRSVLKRISETYVAQGKRWSASGSSGRPKRSTNSGLATTILRKDRMRRATMASCTIAPTRRATSMPSSIRSTRLSVE
jgi:hypothetical protein